MPNMLPANSVNVVSELYEKVDKFGERSLFPGAYAVVRLVVDENGGLCVDNRDTTIYSTLMGETNKTIAAAEAAASAEITRLQGCTTDACFKNNGHTTSQAFGCKYGSGAGTQYAVVAFISQSGAAASNTRLREVLDGENDFDWLEYVEGGGDDYDAIQADCD